MPVSHKFGDNLLSWAFATITGIDIEDLKAKQEEAFARADPNSNKQSQQLIYENLMFRATRMRLGSKESFETAKSTLVGSKGSRNSSKTIINASPSSEHS